MQFRKESGLSPSQALRTCVKTTEALATAKPYSIAYVGLGHTFIYRNGCLWYADDSTLRLLETRQSPKVEIVIDQPSLLSKTVFRSQQKVAGSISFLHYHEGVLSCLYRYSHPRRGGWLIAVDVRKPTILISTAVASTEKLFARHDREFLYYGVSTSNGGDDRKRWDLHGYDLKTGLYLGRYNFLYDLIGDEIGATICFEVIDGFFYAISNETTYAVEEVDWTSFYHGRRFPLSTPIEGMVEKTEDSCMWRRQHSEGTIDDRWTSLALATDETTGQIKIIESRKEFPGSLGRRTVYITRLVFPRRSEIGDSSSLANISTSSNEGQRRLALAAETQDRLALTVTLLDTPHFSPPQRRLRKDVHSEPMQSCQSQFVNKKTPARYYNLSASTFIDLVNDIPSATTPQRLRIRVCSRRRKSPAFDQNGILAPQERDSDTGEPIEGPEEEYEDGPIEMWPPALSAGGHACEDATQRQYLHMLMNPPNCLGNVRGIFDETSLVYSTGQDGKLKTIVFVSFDPGVHLHGLKKMGPCQNIRFKQ